MSFNPTYATVENEGCQLHYWHQGTGPLLMLIPGGGGRGQTYDPIFEFLDLQYTVCTLDRRRSGKSTAAPQQTLNPSQQVRDIIAVMKDMGFEKANVFGNSGGGIIALHFAAIHPEYLDRVISHEAPTSLLLPDVETIHDRLFSILAKSKSDGPEAAFADFRAMQKGFESFASRRRGSASDIANFLQNEFAAFALYCPDLGRVVCNGVRTVVAAGSRSEDAWYARTTLQQQKRLACPHVVFPGNHAGFELEPESFAAKLLAVLEEM